jgi:putative zinc finger/helix-turn-helix YgiT family protein
MEMKSPFTGGEVIEIQTTEMYTMRGQEFEVTAPCYQCVDSGEQFTTDEQDEVFLREQERIYRQRNSLPTAAQLKERREYLGLSANEASRLLGFGINQFRQYEAGDFPSEPNMILLQQFCDDFDLSRLLQKRMLALPQRTLIKLERVLNAMPQLYGGSLVAARPTPAMGRHYGFVQPGMHTYATASLPNVDEGAVLALYSQQKPRKGKEEIEYTTSYSGS